MMSGASDGPADVTLSGSAIAIPENARQKKADDRRLVNGLVAAVDQECGIGHDV
jgi:hypothetical protein